MGGPNEPPTNVRINTPDRSIPCEVYYRGQDDEGLHVWAVTAKIPSFDEDTSVTCDTLPSRTALIFDEV